MLSESELSNIAPAELRLKEAEFFKKKFVEASGPPKDSYFEMITYFDAYLFCLISIEEMVTDAQKKKLNSVDIFKFFKAARNLTTHHSILAAPKQKPQYTRPLSRRISATIGGNLEGNAARFRVEIDKFREDFKTASTMYPRAKRGFDEAEPYLQSLESSEKKEIFFSDMMQDGLNCIRAVLTTK